MTIGIVLAVIGLASLLGVALSTTAVMHLDMVAENTCQMRAVAAAESALSATIDQLLANPATFGHHQDVVRLNGEAAASVTFDPTDPLASVNNLTNDRTIQGPHLETVPLFSAHLLARGQYRSASTVYEALLEIPPFPYALAAAGKMQSTGGLLVDGSGHDAGAIAANSIAPDAIALSRGTIIDGDVSTCGGVQMPADGVTLLGSLQTGQEPVALPAMAASGYDIDQQPGLQTLTGPVGDLTVQGLMRAASSVQAGTITLQDGVLFVAGDLTATSIAGEGAVISEGSVTVTDSAQVVNEKIALVADGDVQLLGHGNTVSAFQGEVAAGNLTARDILVNGVCLQLDPQGSTALHNVHLTQSSSLSSVTFSLTPPPNVPPLAWGGWQGLAPIAGSNDGSALATAGVEVATAVISGKLARMQVVRPPYAQQVDVASPPPILDRFGNAWSMLIGIYSQDLPKLVNPLTGTSFLPRDQLNTLTVPVVATLGFTQPNARVGQNWVIGGARGDANIRSLILTSPTVPTEVRAPLLAALTQGEQWYFDALALRLGQLQQEYAEQVQATGQANQSAFRVDLNQFIHVSDAARIVLWRPYVP
ncbi:MAG: hypothetical protein ACYCW6_24445 [Candidatus Xenobia bacterium]